MSCCGSALNGFCPGGHRGSKCYARATDGGASPTLAAWGRNQAARSRLTVQCWDLGGPGNGPHLLLCSLAASRSARCSKDATPCAVLLHAAGGGQSSA